MRAIGVWWAGARPRTLAIGVAPVLVGTASAVADAGRVLWWRAAAALFVAVALQVGVNYANDYSDGVRGTDHNRSGPVRLTASGLATPAAVRRAALLAFVAAAAIGGVVCLVVEPLLLLLGAAALGAGVLYTGGPRPYGYLGLGELMVLVFFGFAATVGSAYVQIERVPGAAWWASLTLGLLACGVLLANNVRDLDGDARSGKHTLAVRVGARRARRLFALCTLGSFVGVVAIGLTQPWALLALVALPMAARPVRLVETSEGAAGLVDALRSTTRLELAVAVLLSVGLCLS
jgi:1,4-dihydroxy-2-naphthoate octaprenyltransferase